MGGQKDHVDMKKDAKIRMKNNIPSRSDDFLKIGSFM